MFTKVRAVAAVIGGVVLVAVPVMVEHSPDEVVSGLGDWAWLLYPLAAVCILYATLSLGFFLGQREVSGSDAASGSADGNDGRSINDLIYAVRTATSALLDDGELRIGELQNQLARISRDHVAWHDAMRHKAREDFLGMARRAAEARELKTSWMAGPGTFYGDYPPASRAKFHADIEQRSENLILALEAQKLLGKARLSEKAAGVKNS